MGAVNQGIPRDIVRELAEISGASVFIETGTFRGGTTRWASTIFPTVHTIERAEGLFREFSPELAKIDGVTPHLGDSRQIMPNILESLGGKKAVYWLDGHWSAGETAGEGDECPLMAELECLANRTNDLILIDDARFFLSAPPPPHDYRDWPTIAEITAVLPERGSKQFIQVIDDVIFIVPRETQIVECLVTYAQRAAKREQDRVRRPKLLRGSIRKRFQAMISGKSS